MENNTRKRVDEEETLVPSNKRVKNTEEQGLRAAGMDPYPLSDCAVPNMLAFYDSVVGVDERGQRQTHQRSSLQEYPSVQDIEYPNPEDVKMVSNAEITLASMMRPCVSAGGPVIRVGDTLMFPVVGFYQKEVEITRAANKSPIDTPQGPFIPATESLVISVPAGLTERFSAGPGNIVFPNALHPDAVIAPKAIWKAALTQMPAAAGMPGKGTCFMWEKTWVFRGQAEQGILHDIRLALQFSMNESDFACQLTFSEGRQRDLGSAAKAGFYFLTSGALFLKVKTDSFQSLNQSLLIDLGEELNDMLATVARDGHSIVLVDNRCAHADGIPTAGDENAVTGLTPLSQVLREGPNIFLTVRTLKIAGHSGWTNGHAHMGLPSLCRNDLGETVIEAPFKYLYRAPATKREHMPAGEEVRWTRIEKDGVAQFYAEQMKGKIRHYPLPLTRSRLPLNVQTMQYRKTDEGWIVDTRAHPEIYVKEAASDEDFAEAMKYPRTRAVPDRKGKAKEVVGSSYDAEPWASYETAG